MFNMHEQSIPERPVDEKSLDALFARIDQYEAERPKARQRQSAAAPSVWARLSEMLTGWVPKPALLAVAAAAVLAVVVVPMLDRPASQEFGVLRGDWEPAFSVTFHLKTGEDAAQFQKMIDAAHASGKLVGEYRIERRSATEYRVVFAQKPGVTAMSELDAQWRSAPNVADVTIDTGPTR
jgi:hypothetical protein